MTGQTPHREKEKSKDKKKRKKPRHGKEGGTTLAEMSSTMSSAILMGAAAMPALNPFLNFAERAAQADGARYSEAGAYHRGGRWAAAGEESGERERE